MTKKTKILFIGIDAADKDLIFEWTSQGLLPNFQSLLDRGAWGITTNPVGLYVGAIWPSFATGVSAAGHGCYCYSQLTPGSYHTRQYSVLVLATGLSVEPGQIEDAIAIEDFAPTLAALLNITLPYAEGKAIAPLMGVARAKV